MGTDSILQQIESALGKRHPQADALLWQRVDFICEQIKELKSAQQGVEPTVSRCAGFPHETIWNGRGVRPD